MPLEQDRMQLLAIAYPDTVTATVAMDELEPFSTEFMIRRDEVAAVVRDDFGTFTTYTNAVIPSGGSAWTMLWCQLFAILFFIPILGMGVGPGLAPIVETVRGAGLDPLFMERVAKHAVPGSAVLFVLVQNVSPDVVVSALDGLGGTVLQSELSGHAREMLQDAFQNGSRVA
jgi:uncharacterized membrane protein